MKENNPEFRRIQAELARPFAPEDLEWRIQTLSKNRTSGLAVAYVTSRAIQDRLDAVVGSENWRNEFRPWQSTGRKEAQICGLSIYLPERGEWITKWDGAENTEKESVKGGLSDSMKRAAVQWGIGRVLYKLRPVWVSVDQRGSSYAIQDAERPKLNNHYLTALQHLGLTPASPGGLESQLTPRVSGSSDNPQNTTAVPSRGDASGSAVNHGNAMPSGGAMNHGNTMSNDGAMNSGRRSGTQGGNVTQFPNGGAAPSSFTVLDVQLSAGKDSQPTTTVTMIRDMDRRQFKAFFKGRDPALVRNTRLCNVKLESRVQGSVTFLTLEGYQILPVNPRAA